MTRKLFLSTEKDSSCCCWDFGNLFLSDFPRHFTAPVFSFVPPTHSTFWRRKCDEGLTRDCKARRGMKSELSPQMVRPGSLQIRSLTSSKASEDLFVESRA